MVDMEKEFNDWFSAEVDGGAVAESIAWKAWQAAISSVVVDIESLPSASYTDDGVVYRGHVEDALEKVATMYLKLMQIYDPTHYTDTEGKPFIADQFTRDFVVKVDAHSNSPIFTEDLKNLAFNLFKAGAIDQEALLDMLEPPMKQLLKDKLKSKMSMSGTGSLPASATEAGSREPMVG